MSDFNQEKFDNERDEFTCSPVSAQTYLCKFIIEVVNSRNSFFHVNANNKLKYDVIWG